MLTILNPEEEDAMIQNKIEKYAEQIKNPIEQMGQMEHMKNAGNQHKPIQHNVQYLTIQGYENADLCDDPEYVKAMYGEDMDDPEALALHMEECAGCALCDQDGPCEYDEESND